MQNNKKNYKLKTDEEFKRFISPLSAAERKQLEENILQDGCRDALVVWDETIIDGHNRYEICTKHKIPFAIDNIDFQSRESAISWICANQLGRRNISEETRRYLIGKRYEVEKRLNEQRNTSGINQYTIGEVFYQNDKKPEFDENTRNTGEKISKEYRIGPATVVRYGRYARALDTITKVTPELSDKIISGQLKLTQESVIKIARLSPQEIKRVGVDLIKNPNAYMGYTNERGMMVENTPNKVQLAQMQIGAIKEMPEYDPNAEIQSLALTMPSWVSSINRVRTTTKFSEISDTAREKIKTALGELKAAADKMLATVCEDK